MSAPEPQSGAIPPLVKFTNATNLHNGLTLHAGENEALEPWSTALCAPGGIYAAVRRDPHLPQWMTYKEMAYAWDCQVAPGSPWQLELRGKVKAHRVILSNCRPIAKFLMELPDAQFVPIVASGYNISISGDLALRAISIDASLVMHIRMDNQTEEVQMAAVQRDPWTIASIARPVPAALQHVMAALGETSRVGLWHRLRIMGVYPMWTPFTKAETTLHAEVRRVGAKKRYERERVAAEKIDREKVQKGRTAFLRMRLRNIELVDNPTEAEQSYVTSRMQGWTLVPHSRWPGRVQLRHL